VEFKFAIEVANDYETQVAYNLECCCQMLYNKTTYATTS
jgi:hypothetical protein